MIRDVLVVVLFLFFFFFSSRRRHTRSYGDWSSDVCSSDLFVNACEEVSRHYKRALQCRQKLMAIPRAMKPKQYRRQLWELGRLAVRTSRLCRAIKFQSTVIRYLIDRLRSAVDDVKPIEADLSKVQRKLETWPGERAEGVKELRREQRSHG